MQLNLFFLLSLVTGIIVNPHTVNNSEKKHTSTYGYQKKHQAIKLFPNPSYDGKISISTTKTDTLHFYIFDLEGTLINQTVLTSHEEKTITNLSKGTYIYDVFENDESIEEGKIIVK